MRYSLIRILDRLENLVGAVNYAIEHEDTSHLINSLGCIGTDIENARAAAKAEDL